MNAFMASFGAPPLWKDQGIIFFLKGIFKMNTHVNAKKERKKCVFLIRIPSSSCVQTLWLSGILEKHLPWRNTK